ncbi:MAG: amidohydrolase family protein [Chloroflexi bacterium]|nr:amidohydrolase family protein [Chloroflexota bacterium]
MTTRQAFLADRVARPELDGWRHDAAILVGGGRIETVMDRRALPSDLASTHAVHDLGVVSVLPGFVETHIHMHFAAPLDYRDIARPEPMERSLIRATSAMRTLLLSGATTVRDTGSREDVALAIRAALRDGVIAGPRLQVVGAPITTTAGHYWFLGGEADSTDAVVSSIRARKRAGVDAIKVMASGGGYTPTSNPRSQQYGLATMQAIVEEGHRLGLPVLAHSLTGASNAICVQAGVDTIIHGGVWWTEHPIRDQAYAYDPAVADLMAQRGIWVDPTIGEVELHREHHDQGRPDKPDFEHWALPDVPSDLEPRLVFMRDMADRGVRFIGGMGMGMPIVTFDSVACSAAVYARLLGMDPWRAIGTITADAAAALGLARVTGTIRPGLAADLVAVDGDPITDLGRLRMPRDVIQAGHLVVRDGRALV